MQGLPPSILSADLADNAVAITVDADLYPLDAIYGASFTFLDRCFVFLERSASGFRVTLGAKDPRTDPAALRPLVGEFANELLACAWRARITEKNRATIEAVTMQAIGGAMGPAASLDELEDFDFSEEPFEDPLGIAMSWEEKYGKKSSDGVDGADGGDGESE